MPLQVEHKSVTHVVVEEHAVLLARVGIERLGGLQGLDSLELVCDLDRVVEVDVDRPIAHV